ncbi:UNVERIFIED_CONTAM: hypothetical protein Slati_1108000 [Sesamum latifolium]|uniref:Reverse transcriptase zinc-binding domain-containing protein n=1 Tax=Sesamum latifolium TaxID=2727402 RepID=A0AAW2XBZ2_9LAMI
MMATADSSSCYVRKWSLVWDTRLIPKIKLFIWKICFKALPTMSNLRSRGVKLEGGCPLCDWEEEDIMHILSFCLFSRLVWAISGIEWNLVVPSFADAEEWLREIYQEVDKSVFELVAAISWSLGCNRNLRIFEGQILQAVEVVEMAKRQVRRVGSFSIDPG